MQLHICIQFTESEIAIAILYSTVELIDVKVKVVKCNEQNNVLVSINEKTRSTYKLNMLRVGL